jgi:hypothetical protein
VSQEQYAKEKELVAQLHYMANEYDSDYLRKVADEIDIMIEEKKSNDRKSTRLETVGRSTSS